MMTNFYTPSLLITDYYDSLISQLDIYTEMRIKEINEKGLSKMIENKIMSDNVKTFGVDAYNNPYESQKYAIDRTQITKTEIAEISEAEAYANKTRQKAIDEIRRVQEENLKHYRENREKFKVDRENLNEEKLEELKSQLFENRYCFLVLNSPKTLCYIKDGEQEQERYMPIFNLHTVITDFYLRKSDIDYIRKRIERTYTVKNRSKKIYQRFLLVNQVQKYIKDTLFEGLNGYELIRINQKTLFEIEHIEIETGSLRLNTTDFSEFDDIKSLSLHGNWTKIIDLNSFSSLEYLSLKFIKICKFPFQNLHKLIKITLDFCDLFEFEFDFDSLNSLSSLQIIEITMRKCRKTAVASFKLDLNELNNLKWLDLKFYKKFEKFELITNSSNQLSTLNISAVDLSQQINGQFFYGMTNLIKLTLINTQLTNVEFLDTDRLGNLEILDLTNNRIGDLRKGVFSKLNKLKSLNLYFNCVKRLVPGVFEGLKCLEELYLCSNPFRNYPIDKRVFEGLVCLKILVINNYYEISENFDYLKIDDLTFY